jgi:ankyrin repeat protein
MGASFTRLHHQDFYPSYYRVVKPLLDKNKGNASELMHGYPNFNPNGRSCDLDDAGYYLEEACWRLHVNVAHGLLQCGANLLYRDKCGRTLLHWACWSQDRDSGRFVSWILREHAAMRAMVDSVCQAGNTPLHYAAGQGASAVVRVLLAYGADPTCKGERGMTAAQHARAHRRPKIDAAEQLEAAERAYSHIHNTDGWRPRNHEGFPSSYRDTMYTLAMLAKITQ